MMFPFQSKWMLENKAGIKGQFDIKSMDYGFEAYSTMFGQIKQRNDDCCSDIKSKYYKTYICYV